MPPGGSIDVREALGSPSLRNVLIAAILGALIAGASAAWVLNGDPVYQSGATLLIDQPKLIAAPGGEGAVAKLNALRSKYVGLLRTEVVVEPVAEATGIPAGEIAGSVGAAVPPQSLLFVVTARSGSPQRAQAIAAGASAGLLDYLEQEQSAAGIPADDRITLTVVTEARPGGKVEPTVGRAISVAAAAAVLAMGLAYVAVQLVTTSRRGA
jgi:capsular polysaccharide biosynthesis protein